MTAPAARTSSPPPPRAPTHPVAQAAAELLQVTAQKLVATVVHAADTDDRALPIDLSLGEGPRLLAVVEALSPARLQLERSRPRSAEEAVS